MAFIAAVKSKTLPFAKVVLTSSMMLVGAVPFAILQFIEPSQYSVVVIDAVERLWPLIFAVAIAVLSSLLGYWTLHANGHLSKLRAVLVGILPLALVISAALVAGPSAVVLICGVASLFLLAGSYWLIVHERILTRLPRALRFSFAPPIIACLLYATLGALTLISPIDLPRRVGSLAFFTALCGLTGILMMLASQRPKLGAFGLAYVIFAALFFPSNYHRIPTLSANSETKSLDETLGEWVKNRKDLAAYRELGLPYPVIFVSSEGGGIYAAAHAYGLLSAISQNCPTFAQHVFAVVGVSGGALGNALFVSELSGEQYDQTACTPSNASIRAQPVTEDHLSPVLARLLTVELPDRLLPWPWTSRDRAQVLADSFLAVGRDAAFLEQPIKGSFDVTKSRPAVISVATNVADGRRFVFSPFAPEFWSGTAHWWPNGPEDISVVNAAGVAARFPWITPTGLLTGAGDKTFLLADGGYFENSGADTVLDIVNAIRFTSNSNQYPLSPETEERLNGPNCDEQIINVVRNFHEQTTWKKCEVRIFPLHLAIASNDNPPEDPFEPKLVSFEGTQSFSLDPIASLLSTRGSRGEIALSRADLELCGTKLPGAECYGNPGSSFGFIRNDIRPLEWELPLGWYLPSALFEILHSSALDQEIFDYRNHKRPFEYDLEILIYHLDTALYKDGADPSIEDLLGGP